MRNHYQPYRNEKNCQGVLYIPIEYIGTLQKK